MRKTIVSVIQGDCNFLNVMARLNSHSVKMIGLRPQEQNKYNDQ